MMMPQPRENGNGETESQELGEVEVDHSTEEEGIHVSRDGGFY
jgi:hypothetical protein